MATSTRRTFLKRGAHLGGTLWLSSSAIAALAPGRTWALELTTLETREAQTLVKLVRHIYPHDDLDDAVYAFVVRDLDQSAAADEVAAEGLSHGLAALHNAAGGDWLSTPEPEQLRVVESIAGSPFFEQIRSTAVVALYNNELAFAHFGYEGSAFEHGGYLERGFNDLDWLPSPPPNASPR